MVALTEKSSCSTGIPVIIVRQSYVHVNKFVFLFEISCVTPCLHKVCVRNDTTFINLFMYSISYPHRKMLMLLIVSKKIRIIQTENNFI